MTGTGRLPGPGEHGGDAGAVAVALGLDPARMIDLSASTNPFAPDVTRLAAAELRSGCLALTRYPAPGSAERALADAIGVDADTLVLTNGGAEAIALAAAEIGAGHVAEPEFALYRRHLPRIDPTAPRWRSNPSNPLGCLAAPAETAGVWDEAFYPLATGRWTRGDEGVWRLGSLTKLWSCPGLRLGYAIAPDATAAARLRLRQPAWSVNGLALALLPTLLAGTDLPAWSEAVRTWRASFAGELVRLGYAIRETEANWVLVDAPYLRRRLAPHGIVVRDCASFGLEGTARVALPRAEELDRVVGAFAAVAE